MKFLTFISLISIVLGAEEFKGESRTASAASRSITLPEALEKINQVIASETLQMKCLTTALVAELSDTSKPSGREERSNFMKNTYRSMEMITRQLPELSEKEFDQAVKDITEGLPMDKKQLLSLRSNLPYARLNLEVIKTLSEALSPEDRIRVIDILSQSFNMLNHLSENGNKVAERLHIDRLTSPLNSLRFRLRSSPDYVSRIAPLINATINQYRFSIGERL